MPLPTDYVQRVYAGVLGKIIGVYLGRPFEGWHYERIMEKLGEISYYVHDKLNAPLIVTDDDISGTFTFLRALPDNGNTRALTPEQIGQTWLNYLIEKRTVLWWGGIGTSTEHTAYLRLKHGIPAPESGSIARNGKVVAEQIGAQIFIDGWGMVSPGDPAQAADLARRAASVSHDGEAIYGAQVIAAMEAQAFVEHDLNALFDTASTLIPKDSIIYRMTQDIREWHTAEADWRKTRERIAERYGYDTYGGGCHMVPNHALIILALLYGNDDFQRALMIANTSGWDTDCNSGNVGCILGIKNGLQGIDAGPDWRGPVADQLYLPTADGGRAVSDAVTETYHVVNIGRALLGEAPLAPKGGARFHFELPGSVQGFRVQQGDEHAGQARLENVVGHSQSGERSLALHYQLASGQHTSIATPTFTPPETIAMGGYGLDASPTLYPGQTLHAVVTADQHNPTAVSTRLIIQHYSADEKLETISGPEVVLEPGLQQELSWHVPATGGQPITRVGIAVSSAQQTDGSLYLDYLTWDGTPAVVFTRPSTGGSMWKRAWISAVDDFGGWDHEIYRLIQNEGRGLLIQGTREWSDYRVSTTVTPHLAKATGIGARVQGMRRYYALLLCDDGTARLVKYLNNERVLAEKPFPWDLYQSYDLSLQVEGTHLQGWVNGQLLFDLQDNDQPLTGGGVALLCEEGRVHCSAVTVGPAHS